MLKVGIIGCGSIARQRHAYEYSRIPTVEIAGFYDFNRERAEAMVRDFGGNVYESAEELLEDPEIQAVSICVANKDHARLTVCALEQGKDVLCEKPMAGTLKECEAMLEAAKKTGRRLLLDHNQRLAPAHVKAKQVLESGELMSVYFSPKMMENVIGYMLDYLAGDWQYNVGDGKYEAVWIVDKDNVANYEGFTGH